MEFFPNEKSKFRDEILSKDAAGEGENQLH